MTENDAETKSQKRNIGGPFIVILVPYQQEMKMSVTKMSYNVEYTVCSQLCKVFISGVYEKHHLVRERSFKLYKFTGVTLF